MRASLRRLWVVWAVHLGFLPLYAAAGRVMQGRWDARPPDVLARIELTAMVAGVLLALTALAMVPVLRRLGVPYPAACLFAWTAADAVALAGVVAWVEGSGAGAFGIAVALSASLMAVLAPSAERLTR